MSLIQCTHVLKSSRTKEKLRSGELLTTGDEWPAFLYQDYTCDLNDPWRGLFRSSLLVKVCLRLPSLASSAMLILQAFKHVFTSPSSVDKEPKATRSGNARIHGMVCITLPSIAYIATQVCHVHFRMPIETYWSSMYRLDSLLAHPQSSPGQTLQLTRKGSTTPSLTFSKTLMSKRRSMTLLYGGICQLIIPLSLNAY